MDRRVMATEDKPFVPPDWDAPLDVEALLAQVPPAATVMGVFFSGAVEWAMRAGAEPNVPTRYEPFKDYPLTDHIRVLVECARAAAPNQSLRRTLRQMGRDAFRDFVASMVGWPLFGIAGRSWERAVKLISRAYDIAGPVGSAKLLESSPTQIIIGLRGIWNLADSWHVGIFEAGLEHVKEQGEVWVRCHTIADVDIRVRLTRQT